MKILQKILVFVTIIVFIRTKVIEIQCPEICKCDFYENYRRANCTRQNLVTLQSEIPNKTELLDLSFNQISDLDNHVFCDEGLLELKLLNMSYNKVSQIHMSAFEGLTNLKTLDLSYNAMRYIIPHWFWSLQSLEELYLRGNNFGNLPSEPQFESTTLKKLDLSKGGISFVGADAFMKTQHLETLDLSENLIISLNVSVLKPLVNLTMLKLTNNPLRCNSEIEGIFDYCTKKGIHISADNPCAIKPVFSDMFERMVVAPAEEEKNSWIFDEPENTTTHQHCQETTNSTVKEKESPGLQRSGLFMQIINLSPILSAIIVFTIGILIGLILGCSIQINNSNKSIEDLHTDSYTAFDEGGHLKRSRSATSFSSRRSRSNSIYSRQKKLKSEILMLNECAPEESTPVMQRRIQL